MDRVKMIHPTRKDRFGKPMIWEISQKTAKSGKAKQMGFLNYTAPEAPPSELKLTPTSPGDEAPSEPTSKPSPKAKPAGK